MKGTAKQIKWATEIQTKVAAEAQPLIGKAAHYDRIINLILSIDEASFWIDYRDSDFRSLLSSLSKGGLRNKGNGYSNLIKVDAAYTVTETWTEIIQDGKGGHYETKSKIW